MNNEYLMNEGCERLLIATQSCGVVFERCDDEHDGALDDDDGYLSFTTTIKATPFMTDDGEVKPPPVTFEMQYDRASSEYVIIIGEGDELCITYGNVMAYMYFNSITVSA